VTKREIGNGATEVPVALDVGGRACVQLILRLRDLTDNVPGGALVHVVATDPIAPLDIASWCHLIGHTYLGPQPDSARPTYVLRISHHPARSHPRRPWRQTASAAPERHDNP